MLDERFDPHDPNPGKDKDFDRIIRPQALGEFTGQDKIIANLKIFVKAARMRDWERRRSPISLPMSSERISR